MSTTPDPNQQPGKPAQPTSDAGTQPTHNQDSGSPQHTAETTPLPDATRWARQQAVTPPSAPQSPAPAQDTVAAQPVAPAAPTAAAPTAPVQPATLQHPLYPEQAPTAEQPQFETLAPAAGKQPFPEQSAFTGEDAPPPPAAQPKNRFGMLIAGLAIGTLLGGVAGGGVAAVVSSNTENASVVQQSGTLTLSNSETATAISGVAAVATPSVVTLQVESGGSAGSGSGVIISDDGYIVTNAHVVTLDGAAEGANVVVKLSDGRLYPAKVVGTDPYADLAVVKIEAEGLSAVEFADSSELNVGDLAVAIGAPMNLANTVTSGVVSAVYRGISVGSPLIPSDPSDELDDNGGGTPWDFDFGAPGEDSGRQQQQQTGGSVTIPVVQTDASINPGNSGGALLNGDGKLIGINVAIASPTSSEGVAGSDGLGFAIPSNLVSRVTDAIIAGEQPSHGLLGASVGDSLLTESTGVSRAGGVVSEVMSGSAAEKAGLQTGDVITAVNGVPASDGTTVSALIRMNEGGSEVTINYIRNGEERQTTATLGTLDW